MNIPLTHLLTHLRHPPPPPSNTHCYSPSTTVSHTSSHTHSHIVQLILTYHHTIHTSIGLVNCTTIDWFHTWPAEALQEVAMKFLASVDFSEDSFRLRISSVFADMHLSVITASARMLLELKRYNYVTPTNYLELVKGYRNLLNEKSNELKASASKLANGLAKLTDASEQVAELSKELEVCYHLYHWRSTLLLNSSTVSLPYNSHPPIHYQPYTLDPPTNTLSHTYYRSKKSLSLSLKKIVRICW